VYVPEQHQRRLSILLLLLRQLTSSDLGYSRIREQYTHDDDDNNSRTSRSILTNQQLTICRLGQLLPFHSLSIIRAHSGPTLPTSTNVYCHLPDSSGKHLICKLPGLFLFNVNVIIIDSVTIVVRRRRRRHEVLEIPNPIKKYLLSDKIQCSVCQLTSDRSRSCFNHAGTNCAPSQRSL